MGVCMPRIRSWMCCVVLLVMTGMLYGPFLQNPLVFDDMQFFSFDGMMLPQFAEFHPLTSRWLPYATMAWTMNLFGTSLVPLRIESLLLHWSVGVALFFFIRNLYQQVLGVHLNAPVGLPVIWGAFFCALLFLLNPVAVYGAGYLIERTIVMATLFSLLSLLAYLRGLSAGNQKWLWLSVLFYWMAVMSKSNAVMLPAVLVAMTILIVEYPAEKIKKLLPVFCGFSAGAVFVILQSKGLLGATYETSAVDMLETIHVEHGYFYSVITQSGLFFKYLFLWVFPNTSWMSVDMREPFAQSVFSLYGLAVLGFVAYGLLAIRLLLKRGTWGLLGFAMLFPWMLFFTEFSVVRIQESFVLYRSYLWMPGCFLVLPLMIQKLEGKFVAIVFFLLSLIFASLALGRLATFQHRFLLWDDAASLIENKQGVVGLDRIYANRGAIYSDLLRFPEAVDDLKRAISLRPQFGYYHHSLAVIYLHSNDNHKALSEFGIAVKLAPENSRGYYGMGLAYIQLNQPELAKSNFDISCQKGLKPGCEKLAILESRK